MRVLGAGLGVAGTIAVAAATTRNTAAVLGAGASLAGWFLDGGSMSKAPRSALVQGGCEGAVIGVVLALVSRGRDTGIFAAPTSEAT